MQKVAYILAREPWKITLLEVLNCLEVLDTKSSEEATHKTVEEYRSSGNLAETDQAINLIITKVYASGSQSSELLDSLAGHNVLASEGYLEDRN